MRKQILAIAIVSVFFIGGYLILNKNISPTSEELNSRKTVEDYFIEHMRVSADEAKKLAADGVVLRISKDATLSGIIGNLYYYGFIDDEDWFNKQLENSSDSTSGKADSIKVGKNTIDVNSTYYLNYKMTPEDIADTLIHKGKFDPNFTQYNYLFMPSGPDK